jgi:hypothetical protein
LARADAGFALPPLQLSAHAASKSRPASPIARQEFFRYTDAGRALVRDLLPAFSTPDPVVIQVSFEEEIRFVLILVSLRKLPKVWTRNPQLRLRILG